MPITVTRTASSNVTFSTPQEIIINHADDSIKIGDGTDFLAINNDGSINVVSTPQVGAATEAKQDTEIARLTSIRDRLDSSVAVTGTFYQATQPVSAASLPLPTGAATESTLSTLNTKIPTLTLSGDRLKVDVPAGASGLTDSELRASPVPVSGTFYPATQPVSGSVSVSNFPATQAVTGTFWQATQPVSGTVAVSNFPATQAVSGTFWQATQPVSIATLPTLTAAASPSSAPIGSISLGNSTGKTNVMRTGTLVTTAVTADQVILTYTVTAAKTFYMTYFNVTARLTTFAATATNFGTASIESPASTKLLTEMVAHAGTPQVKNGVTFTEPVPIAAGTVIRVVCTPSATTSFTWIANLGGYEK
jgi:hypothetical protein